MKTIFMFVCCLCLYPSVACAQWLSYGLGESSGRFAAEEECDERIAAMSNRLRTIWWSKETLGDAEPGTYEQSFCDKSGSCKRKKFIVERSNSDYGPWPPSTYVKELEK